MRIDENEIKIKLYLLHLHKGHHYYFKAMLLSLVFSIYSLSPAFSSICMNITDIKKEEIEVSLTNVFHACAIGHSAVLFIQAVSIFNINDITNVIE